MEVQVSGTIEEDRYVATRLESGARTRLMIAPSPLVTIISVVYKDREATRLLIDNLAPFRGPNLEIVFVDGGSADGTVALLGANEDSVDYWMSEPDRASTTR